MNNEFDTSDLNTLIEQFEQQNQKIIDAFNEHHKGHTILTQFIMQMAFEIDRLQNEVDMLKRK